MFPLWQQPKDRTPLNTEQQGLKGSEETELKILVTEVTVC